MTKLLPARATLIPATAKCAFKGEIYEVWQWEQLLFDGTTSVFEMLRRPDTVTVLLVKEDKLVLLSEQQPNWEKAKSSFIGGRVDPGEEPLEAAKRELAEETGYSCANWKLVRIVQPVSKIEWFIYTYVAWDIESQVVPHLDPGEKIEVIESDLIGLKNLAAQTESRLDTSILDMIKSDVSEYCELDEIV